MSDNDAENGKFFALIAGDAQKDAEIAELRSLLALARKGGSGGGGGGGGGTDQDQPDANKREAAEQPPDTEVRVPTFTRTAAVEEDDADDGDLDPDQWAANDRKCCVPVGQFFGNTSPVIATGDVPRSVSYRSQTIGFRAGGSAHVFILSDEVANKWKRSLPSTEPNGSAVRYIAEAKTVKVSSIDGTCALVRHNYGIAIACTTASLFATDVEKGSDPTLIKYIQAYRADGYDITPPQSVGGAVLSGALLSLCRGVMPRGLYKVEGSSPLYVDLVGLASHDAGSFTAAHDLIFPDLCRFLKYMGVLDQLRSERVAVKTSINAVPALPDCYTALSTLQDGDDDIQIRVPCLTSSGMDVAITIDSIERSQPCGSDVLREECITVNTLCAETNQPSYMVKATITGVFADHVQLSTGARHRAQMKEGMPPSMAPVMMQASDAAFTAEFPIVVGDTAEAGYANFCMLVGVCSVRNNIKYREPDVDDKGEKGGGYFLPRVIEGATLKNVDLTKVVVSSRVFWPVVKRVFAATSVVDQITVPAWWEDMLTGSDGHKAWCKAALCTPMLSHVDVGEAGALLFETPKASLDDIFGSPPASVDLSSAMVKGPVHFVRDTGVSWKSLGAREFDGDGLKLMVLGEPTGMTAPSLVLVDWLVMLNNGTPPMVRCILYAVGLNCQDSTSFNALRPASLLVFEKPENLAKYAKTVCADLVVSSNPDTLRSVSSAGIDCWQPQIKKEDAGPYLENLYRGVIPVTLIRWNSRSRERQKDQPKSEPKSRVPPTPQVQHQKEGKTGGGGSKKVTKDKNPWLTQPAESTQAAGTDSSRIEQCPATSSEQEKVLKNALKDPDHPFSKLLGGSSMFMKIAKGLGWDKSEPLLARVAGTNPDNAKNLNPKSPYSKLASFKQKMVALKKALGNQKTLTEVETKRLTTGGLKDILNQVGGIDKGCLRLTGTLGVLFSLIKTGESSVVKPSFAVTEEDIVLRRWDQHVYIPTFPPVVVECGNEEPYFSYMYTVHPPPGISVGECDKQCLGELVPGLSCTGDADYLAYFPGRNTSAPNECKVTSAGYCLEGWGTVVTQLVETMVRPDRQMAATDGLPWTFTYSAFTEQWTVIPDQAGLPGLYLEWEYAACTESVELTGDTVSFGITDAQRDCGGSGMASVLARLCVDAFCGKTHVFDVDGEELVHRIIYTDPINTLKHYSSITQDTSTAANVQLVVSVVILIGILFLCGRAAYFLYKMIRRKATDLAISRILAGYEKVSTTASETAGLVTEIHEVLTKSDKPCDDGITCGSEHIAYSGVMDAADATAYLTSIPCEVVNKAVAETAEDKGPTFSTVVRKNRLLTPVRTFVPTRNSRGIRILMALVALGYTKGEHDATVTTTPGVTTTVAMSGYEIAHACLLLSTNGVCDEGCNSTETNDCCSLFWGEEPRNSTSTVVTNSSYGMHCCDPVVLRTEASEKQMRIMNESMSTMDILMSNMAYVIGGLQIPESAPQDTTSIIEWLGYLSVSREELMANFITLYTSMESIRIFTETQGDVLTGVRDMLAEFDGLNLTRIHTEFGNGTTPSWETLFATNEAQLRVHTVAIQSLIQQSDRFESDIDALVKGRRLVDEEPFVPIDTACSAYMGFMGLPVLGDTGFAFNTLEISLPSKGMTSCISLTSDSGGSASCKIRYTDTSAQYPAEVPYWTGTSSPDYNYSHVFGKSNLCSSGYPVGGLLTQAPTFNGLINSTTNNMHCAIARGTKNIGKSTDWGVPPANAESEVCIPWCLNLNPLGDAEKATYSSSSLGYPIGSLVLQMTCWGADDGAMLSNSETPMTESQSVNEDGMTVSVSSVLVSDRRSSGYRLFYGNRSFYGPGAGFGQYGQVPGGRFQGQSRDVVWTNSAMNPELLDVRVVGMSLYWDIPDDPMVEVLATLGDVNSAHKANGDYGLGGTMRMYDTGVYVEQAPISDVKITLSGTFSAVTVSKTSVMFILDGTPTVKGAGESPYVETYGHTVSAVTKIGLSSSVQVSMTNISTGILSPTIATISLGTYLYPAETQDDPVKIPCIGVPAQACGSLSFCDSASGDSRCTSTPQICWDRPFSQVKTLNGNRTIIDGTGSGFTGSVDGDITLVVIIVICIVAAVVLLCYCYFSRKQRVIAV